MQNNLILIFILFILLSCSKSDNLNNKVRILNLELIELNEPANLLVWDTIDGPDLYITISINDSVRFTSNKFENTNISSTPVSFKLDSNIIFHSISDQVKLNLYDKDEGMDQIILKDFYFNPGLFDNSPYFETITCAVCFGTFKITYERAD
jgi:hypothetical protein